MEGTNTVFINDNDVNAAGESASLILSSHFGAANSESDWTLYIQTSDGVASTNQLGTVGNSFARFRFSGAADLAILAGIETNTKFIIAVAKPAAVTTTVSVEATLGGVGGVLSSAITKSSPGTESVEAVITGTDGALSSTITKIAAPEPTVQLELDDFDDDGLEVDVHALITAGLDGNIWYQSSPAVGTLSGGELGLGTTNVPITRIRRPSNDTVRLNDSNASFSLSTHFGSSGTSEWTLYIQTINTDGTFNVVSSDQLISAGGGYVNFRFSDSADQTILDGITSGTKFIIAVAKAAAVVLVPKPVEATLSGTGGVLSSAITKSSPGTETVNAVISSVGGSLSSTITKTEAPPAVPPLQLSDFDTTGLEVDALALITAEISGTIWYRHADYDNNSALGTIEDTDSDLTLGADSSTALIGRIRNTGSGSRILLNANPSRTLGLNTHFGTSGGDSPWTLHIQTSAGTATSNQLWSNIPSRCVPGQLCIQW